MTYYDEISNSYDELYEEEQLKKLNLIKSKTSIKEEDKLLDVGCGTGISTSFFKCNATGIDPSEKLLVIAKEKNPGPFYQKANAEKIPFKDKSFDVVISITALQNLDFIEQGLNEIKRVGKNNFIFSFLKKSQKAREIMNTIKNTFSIIEVLEEEKDIIVFAN